MQATVLAPTKDDIDYYGLLYACQRTRQEFALYADDGSFAAKGRMGSCPLYWNPATFADFSFMPREGLVTFPDGYLYTKKYGRLVCWDPVYYDKPMDTATRPDVLYKIQRLIDEAIDYITPHCDAILLMNQNPGSLMIQGDSSLPVYVCPSMTPKELAEFLRANSPFRRFMVPFGAQELFSDDDTGYAPYVRNYVDAFAEEGLEMLSPFFDAHLIEYVLDCTSPDDRPLIMEVLSEKNLY